MKHLSSEQMEEIPEWNPFDYARWFADVLGKVAGEMTNVRTQI